MTEFHFPVKVIEGDGACGRLPELLGEGPVLLVTDEGLAATPIVDQVHALLRAAGRDVTVHSDIQPNPDEHMVEKLTAVARDLIAAKRSGVPQVVALGGGSAIDTAKAAVCMATNAGPLSAYQWEGRIFEHAPLPLVAIPTTAGTGSEVTGVTVIASRNTKKGIKQPAVFPKIALLDPQLMLSMPKALTASTGMDALTHAIEAYIGRNDNPMVNSLAATAVSLIVRNLPLAWRDGSDSAARRAMAHGSMLAGLAMDQGGLGIVHSLSSALCGILHVAHGEGNALLLPYSMRYNIPHALGRMAELAGLMGIDTGQLSDEQAANAAVSCIEDLQRNLGMMPQLEGIRNKLRQQNDLTLFGKVASGMFLMKNNPYQADSADCMAIFERIQADRG